MKNISRILYVCFSVSILAIISISTAAAAEPVLPMFRTDIEILAYPSGSPEKAATDKQVVEAINQMRNAGFSDRVEQLFTAYENKDIAWDVAQTIIKKIEKGQINSNNISDYLSPDVKLSSTSRSEMIATINEIKSYGDLVNLSASQSKGIYFDRMFIRKEFNQDRIAIKVIDFVYNDLGKNKIKKLPVKFIGLVLSAEPPYKNWRLSKIYIKKIHIKKFS